MQQPLSDRVRALIGCHLRTMLHIETLMLLADDEFRLWDAEQVAAALHSVPVTVAARLADLESGGFIVPDAASHTLFRYAPVQTVDHAAIAELFAAYRQRPVSLVHAIYETSSSPSPDGAVHMDGGRR